MPVPVAWLNFLFSLSFVLRPGWPWKYNNKNNFNYCQTAAKWFVFLYFIFVSFVLRIVNALSTMCEYFYVRIWQLFMLFSCCHAHHVIVDFVLNALCFTGTWVFFLTQVLISFTFVKSIYRLRKKVWILFPCNMLTYFYFIFLIFLTREKNVCYFWGVTNLYILNIFTYIYRYYMY